MIITPGALMRYLGIATATTGETMRLRQAVSAAQAQIEQLSARRFVPYRQSIDHDHHSGGVLPLLHDLHALESVTDANGRPLTGIELIDGAMLRGDLPAGVLTVSGMWGWAIRWRPSGDMNAFALFDNENSVAVTASTAADEEGNIPRFEAGQLIRIEDEIMQVMAVDPVADTLSVRRGLNGTSAVTHAPYQPITIFTPAPQVETLATRWAAWLYRAADHADPTLPEALHREALQLQRVRVR